MPGQLSHDDLYVRIRDIVLEEAAARGQRIDVQRLADLHRVSPTPIREVLYQMVGERLVEAHPSGGFQIVLPDGRTLQDLYGWNAQHLLAAIHLLPDPVMRQVLRPFATTVATLQSIDAGDLIGRVALAIGAASGNTEFKRQIGEVNGRLFRARRAEGLLFSDRLKEIATIVKLNGFDVRNNVRRRVLAYHRRRVEQAAQIAALIT